MKTWAIHHDDGTFEQGYFAKRPRVDSARVFEIERLGDLAVERHDPEHGWVPRASGDRRAAIDAAHDADFPFLRAIDRAVKEIEARIVLGLFPAGSRLAAEADLRGMTVEELARAVLAKAAQHQPDLDRVAAKLSIKE